MKLKKHSNSRRLKLCLVAGARPNFMKIAPLIRAIKKNNLKKSNKIPLIDFLLVHTGQHYDYEMSDIFFKDLEIPKPDIFLNIGSGSHGEQTGKVMISFEQVLLKEKIDMVVVVGDVNSTIACALVATKLHVPVAHVEAGLRSFDRTMPEEINRLLTDQISDYLFTPSTDANENLEREGIAPGKIFMVGDIMIDNLFFNLPKVKKSGIFKSLGLMTNHAKPSIKDYALLTLHRPANVDNKTSLSRIFEALKVISKELPIIFPVHPRTGKMMASFGLDKKYGLKLNDMKLSVISPEKTNTIPPLGYLDCLALMSKAKIVLTDSGGIQEETTVLGIPCLTLRDTTERPITVTEGTNILVHNNTDKIVSEAQKILKTGKIKGKCPAIWDGKTAERVIDVVSKAYKSYAD